MSFSTVVDCEVGSKTAFGRVKGTGREQNVVLSLGLVVSVVPVEVGEPVLGIRSLGQWVCLPFSSSGAEDAADHPPEGLAKKQIL